MRHKNNRFLPVITSKNLSVLKSEYAKACPAHYTGVNFEGSGFDL